MLHCVNCPHKHHREAIGSEPGDARRPLLALISESPGFTELREGRPMSPHGASGRLLAEVLRELAVGRSECWVGNAVNCSTRTGRELEQGQPACASRLMGELAELPASTVIVPLGSAALRTVLAKRAAAILKYRGSVTRLAGGALTGRFVVPTVHPALALRIPAYREVLRRDIARALEIREHGWTSPECAAGRETHVVRELDELEWRLSQLGPEVSFDVETTVDSPLFNKLICFAVSDGTQTLVVPWSAHRDGAGSFWAHPEHAASLTTAALQDRLIVTHNGLGFDMLVAERYGIRHSAIADTLIAFHTLHGKLPRNLGFVASYYVSVPPWKQESDNFADLPRLYHYNGLDGLYTALTWRAIKQELERGYDECSG